VLIEPGEANLPDQSVLRLSPLKGGGS